MCLGKYNHAGLFSDSYKNTIGVSDRYFPRLHLHGRTPIQTECNERITNLQCFTAVWAEVAARKICSRLVVEAVIAAWKLGGEGQHANLSCENKWTWKKWRTVFYFDECVFLMNEARHSNVRSCR